MRYFIPAIIFIVLFGCKQPAPVVNDLKQADSLVINIKPSGPDTAMLNFTTRDKNAINKLANYLNGKTIDEKGCSDDGEFIFYKGAAQLQTVTFNYRNKDCKHFNYNYKGQPITVELNNEAVDFFTALEKGKSTY